LTAIREFSSILLDGLTGRIDDEQREILQIIRTNSEHLSWLIENLFDVSRIEAGTFRIELSQSDLAELIHSVVETMEAHAAKRGITISTSIDKGIPPIFLDDHRIRQVLINLVSNSIKFTPRGGKIEIRAAWDWQSDMGVRVAVSDTGYGIPKEDIPRIFDRFYQPEKGNHGSLGGTGLGLSIVREIIQAHGGSMEVESEPGRGSCFSFRLPHALGPKNDSPDGAIPDKGISKPPDAPVGVSPSPASSS
jgi:two-component system phosphate regulon sensor histidine kinase PhoR